MKRFRPSLVAVAAVAIVACVAVARTQVRPQTAPSVRPKADTIVAGMSTERLARVHAAMQGFVDRHQVSGVVSMIVRQRQVVQLDAIGYQDLSAKRPMQPDTLFFIASMTKPMTSVAVMMLHEEGRFLLTDRVSKFLPAFAHPMLTTGPATRQITIRDLLTHRSGLAYGFADDGPVGRAYRRDGVNDGLTPASDTIADNVDRIAKEPLLFEPGSKWNYGLSTDVLGRLVEVVAGVPLDEFFRTRIFEPLRMRDTGFFVPDDKASRVAVLYTDDGSGGLRPLRQGDKVGNIVVDSVNRRGSRNYFSGGAGIISTAPDYERFLQMLLNGGELDGVRLLSPKTIELMTTSQTGDLTPSPVGASAGFGLGFRIITNPAQLQRLGSVGEYSWDGIWGTSFWVDPKERLAAVSMIQRFPNGSVPLAATFRTTVYQAIVQPAAGAVSQ